MPRGKPTLPFSHGKSPKAMHYKLWLPAGSQRQERKNQENIDKLMSQ